MTRSPFGKRWHDLALCPWYSCHRSEMMKQRLPRWGDRRRCQSWAAELAWFRLRYLDAASLGRCLRWLSRPAACGRVALNFVHGDEIARLYLGVPATHIPLMRRMAADFGWDARPMPSESSFSSVTRMTDVTALPWEISFTAHIVDGVAFVGRTEPANGCSDGCYWPQSAMAAPQQEAGGWGLPAPPPPGLTRLPQMPSQPPPVGLVARQSDARRWPLGRTPEGIPLHVSGRINLYGRQDMTVAWLAAQITHMLAHDPANLVIIDGVGDLAFQLKRKEIVTRLFSKQQLYFVDLAAGDGLNPLMAVPGETVVQTAARWQQWFQGMGVHPDGLSLLTAASTAGVMDLPGLQTWLKRQKRQGGNMAVTSLAMAVGRLTGNRAGRKWLPEAKAAWANFSGGALLVTASGKSWAWQQMLRAAALTTASLLDVRLVLHGFPWPLAGSDVQFLPSMTLISNGPQLVESSVIMTRCDEPIANELAVRFWEGAGHWQEALSLLPVRDGCFLWNASTIRISWREVNNR